MTKSVAARPDWASTLSGVVAALRVAAAGEGPPMRAPDLLRYLAKDLHEEDATRRATASLNSSALQPPSLGLQDFVSAAIAIREPETNDREAALCRFRKQLDLLSTTDAIDASVANDVLDVLELVASRVFGSSPARSEPIDVHHASSATIAKAVLDPGAVTEEARLHLASCVRCQRLVANYEESNHFTPLDQLPRSE